MPETIVIEKSIAVPAEKAWAAIEGIGGLDRWFPIIAACRVDGSGVGAIRVLSLEGGGEMRDRIIEINPEARRLRYHRTHLPFPVSDYFGVVEIQREETGGSRLTWTIELKVAPESRAEIVALVRGAISDGVDGLERELRS